MTSDRQPETISPRTGVLQVAPQSPIRSGSRMLTRHSMPPLRRPMGGTRTFPRTTRSPNCSRSIRGPHHRLRLREHRRRDTSRDRGETSGLGLLRRACGPTHSRPGPWCGAGRAALGSWSRHAARKRTGHGRQDERACETLSYGIPLVPLVPLNPAESRTKFKFCPRMEGGTGARARRDTGANPSGSPGLRESR